jgi:hypothetical protein
VFRDVSVGAVQDCHVHDCEQDGIHVGGKSEQFIVQGNFVHDCADDHISLAGKQISILNNVINANGGVSGGPIATRGGAEQIQIVGNVCRGGVQGGIVLSASQTASPIRDWEIAGNTIVDAGTVDLPFGVDGKSGVLLTVPAAFPGNGTPVAAIERINISGNVIVSPYRHGVALSLGDADGFIGEVAITDNFIYLSNSAVQGSGVACNLTSVRAGTDVHVVNNDIRGAAGPGISVKKSSTAAPTRWDIQNNRVADSGRVGSSQPGMLLDGVNGALVTGNRCQDTQAVKTQSYGLQISNSAGNNLIASNDFSGNINNPGISQSSINATTYFRHNLGDDLAAS